MVETGIVIELPSHRLVLRELSLDFNGTLALDGGLLDGVADRLTKLSERLGISVLTADTHGTARQALAGMPLQVVSAATAVDKARVLAETDPSHVVAIGNGANDVDLVREAALGIVVIGPEAASAAAVAAADIVARDICDALDLLVSPLRIKATLRS